MFELEILNKIVKFGYKAVSISEIDLLKKHLYEQNLGIENIQLTNTDITIITYIISKSEEENETFSYLISLYLN